MRKHRWIILSFLAFGGAASAQSASEILSEGKIISASAITPDHELPKYGSPIPEEVRIHEVFVMYNGDLFLCHMTAARKSKMYPSAMCFGGN